MEQRQAELAKLALYAQTMGILATTSTGPCGYCSMKVLLEGDAES